ncbi:hypothetical protein Vadar_034528 [Vaccinium darrowii]|uniref:Uncharacterized protein n=1 Tax=Vaccinium darrowii TaxID=229202 RepID=A0ACB7XEC1_9ERIC|nr:hypothetical protein Vadar_034528 [Vaccinium darrowii]
MIEEEETFRSITPSLLCSVADSKKMDEDDEVDLSDKMEDYVESKAQSCNDMVSVKNNHLENLETDGSINRGTESPEMETNGKSSSGVTLGSELKFAESEADDLSGGILTMWNHEVFKENQRIIHKNFIFIVGVLFGFDCAIVNVYAPNESNSRRLLWDELLQIRSAYPVP